jgi:putative peptide zinc metalloprotease protein
MDGSRNIEQLQNEYKNSFGRTISVEALDQFIKERLCKSGFIEGYEKLKPRNSQSLLRAKFIILKTEMLEKIYTRHLNFIFEAKIFYSLLFCLFSINLIIFLTHKSAYLNTKSWLVLLSLFICHLFHEVGHAMAAKAKHSSPGNIGFGFYFVLPVFFVDLSDTWNISKKDRIIINLSGILFDYLNGVVLGILFFITGNSLFLIIQIILFTKTFYNLNPIIRSDAYWVISDYLDKPNLNDNSSLEVRLFFKRLFSFQTKNNWKPNFPLLVYGMATTCFWLFVIYHILIQSKTIITDIHMLTFALKQALLFNRWDVSVILSKTFQVLFISFAFYILFRLLKKWGILLYQKLVLVWKSA